MQVQIPKPHGEAISTRKQTIQALVAQLQSVSLEDVRHVNAVLETAGLVPEDFDGKYTLIVSRGEYYLEIAEKQRPKPEPVIAEDSILTAATTDHPNGLPASDNATIPIYPPITIVPNPCQSIGEGWPRPLVGNSPE